MDMLDALDMYLRYASDYLDDPEFPKGLIHESLGTRMAIFSAMYDGLQLGEGEKLELRGFRGRHGRLGEKKRDQELAELESKKVEHHCASPTEGKGHKLKSNNG